MHYDFTAIPDADVPEAIEPIFQHVVTTYASETNKTVSMWRAVPDDLLDFKPHEKTNPIRTIMVHQLLSERRFFAQFVGTEEPPVEELLPAGDKPTVTAYIDNYVWLAKNRLPQFAMGTTAWWLEPRPFFGGLQRDCIWVFSSFRATLSPLFPGRIGPKQASSDRFLPSKGGDFLRPQPLARTVDGEAGELVGIKDDGLLEWSVELLALDAEAVVLLRKFMKLLAVVGTFHGLNDPWRIAVEGLTGGCGSCGLSSDGTVRPVEDSGGVGDAKRRW